MQEELTLFCIPHAGGGTSTYRGWAQLLAPRISVKVLQLPGRESRFREPALSDLHAAVDDLSRAAEPDTVRPYALFGHSMGGLLAFELTHRLRLTTGRMATHLFISGCRPPQMPQVATPFSHLPQADFVRELTRRYGGIPAAILADRDLTAAIVPAIRADFEILEHYRAPSYPPLDCPISVYGGRQDPIVPAATLQAWGIHTSRAFTHELLEGEHFYLQTQRIALCERLVSAL